VVSLSEDVSNSLEDLSQAIQTVAVEDYFSQILSDEQFLLLRCASIYLSAAMMDCLRALIKSLKRSGSA
jgi:hypothetical protein